MDAKKKPTRDGSALRKSDLRATTKDLAGIVPLAKARLLEFDDEDGSSNQISREEETSAWTTAGAIEPPYDPEMLCMLFEHSNSLRQNIDAYATNIDGFGHTLIPIFDLEAEDVDARIGRALTSQMGRKATPAEIAAFKESLPELMAEEKTRGELFFEFCSQDISLVALRKNTRRDKEATGNGYWEVVRNADGEICEFVYMPCYTVRLLPETPFPIVCKSKIKISELKYIEVPKKRRLRLFAQIVDTRIVFFKELGDPRVVSSNTGRTYKTVQALQDEEEGVSPATEIIHFAVHSPRTAYGIPRWIGNLLSVLGSRQAEEVNFLFFENKSVPPLAVLVSGGKMGKDSVKRIEDYVKNNIRGKRNFHKILVLEAEPAQGASGDAAAKMRIQIVPLFNSQQQDALFQNYDASNADKVGGSFRLPRMLRGDIRDFNKSTAEAALTFAEMQVFQPEREEFDFLFNRKILPELGIKLWRFKSLAPITRDPVAMAQMVKDLMNSNVLTPEEGRALAADIFNREFKTIREPWTKQPVPLTLAGFPAGGDTTSMPKDTQNAQEAAVRPTGGREKKRAREGRDRVMDEALRIVAMRKVFAWAEKEIADEQREKLGKLELDMETIKVPAEEMFRLLDQASAR